MFGFQDLIMLTTSVSDASPPAPSPTAARIAGDPAGGVVPSVGVNVFVFTGGVRTWFEKFRTMLARVDRNVCRSRLSASSRCAPSTNLADGSVNVYGAE